MALNKSDKEYLGLLMDQKLAPVVSDQVIIKQTLYGSKDTKETGLVNEVAQMKRKVWGLTGLTNLATAAVAYLAHTLWGGK